MLVEVVLIISKWVKSSLVRNISQEESTVNEKSHRRKYIHDTYTFWGRILTEFRWGWKGFDRKNILQTKDEEFLTEF